MNLHILLIFIALLGVALIGLGLVIAGIFVFRHFRQKSRSLRLCRSRHFYHHRRSPLPLPFRNARNATCL